MISQTLKTEFRVLNLKVVRK